ncbi:hypothetical protein HNO92_000700 [Chromobacterium alkanivorans]|nr:hypothetical protein [Chromobacterium alkanivorans]MCS3817850.1 hypothetical protein [Chromobacterium alkanivorans]MCS3872406.1 hypothetical protein [Chromobacterium alkanivorans]
MSGIGKPESRLTVRAKVFCQENRTGSYHLSDIEVF